MPPVSLYHVLFPDPPVNSPVDVSSVDHTVNVLYDLVLVGLTMVVIAIIFAVLAVIAMWQVFRKAHQHGWAALVPIYNVVVLLRIGRRSPYWLLLLAPVVLNTVIQLFANVTATNLSLYGLLSLITYGCGLAVSIVTGRGVAAVFGRSGTFGVWALGVFPFVGYPILGFGRAQYLPAESLLVGPMPLSR